MAEFLVFPKIPRLNREVVVTEKIDGTNAGVIVTAAGEVLAQSRSRIITPETDNFGFAAWVLDHAEELKQLGEGYHFGEWWGQGIQRKYGLDEKRFSLFNVTRWGEERPACCHVVPVILLGIGFNLVDVAVETLRVKGSYAAPGFMKPEGVVAFHVQGNLLLKATLEKDEAPKGGYGGS